MLLTMASNTEKDMGRTIKMILLQNGKRLFTDTHVANTFWKRFRGLIGKKVMNENEALLIIGCIGIHTCFMRFVIDVVYLDADFKVLSYETVVPWRMGRFAKGAQHVVEVAKGKAEVFEIGFPIQFGISERECYDE
ncbi:MAG: DUF192 domain-containing protein [Ruminococcaceae bacterium]|nr:DUF192 domain-containing protein [Oscillospiraceae bacterium]